MPDVLKLARTWIDDLHIACEVLFSVGFGKVTKSLVGNFSNVKLMIANGQYIVVDILENGVRHIAVGSRGITQSSTIVQILLRNR